MTHPDQELLDAFEAMNRLKAEEYSYDDKPNSEPPPERTEAIESGICAAEDALINGRAVTPEGAACRLSLLIPRLAETRWVDRTLADDGMEALYEKREEIEGWQAKQLLEVAHDLRGMDPLRPFAEAWLDRWTAIGGAVGISSTGRRLYYQPEPDCWTAGFQNEALKPHQRITDPKELTGAAKALSGLLSLVPGGADAVWQVALDHGIALLPPVEG